MIRYPMVDLAAQYNDISSEIDEAIHSVIKSTAFIKGQDVQYFEKELSEFLAAKHVIACANGTDALQLALMALGLEPGDEVVTPAFSYIAAAEACALLGLKPILVDVSKKTFNIDAEEIESKLTEKTKCIIPVHLFGQSCEMDAIMHISEKYNIPVIEDSAQAIGATYTSEGRTRSLGTFGDIATLSFFPSKNLGCYGDGGALICQDDALAHKIRLLANHGQDKKYHHELIGLNSRLDSIQAAILRVKLRHLDDYTNKRRTAASIYHEQLRSMNEIILPAVMANSKHVYHQYTIRVLNDKRNGLKKELYEKGIASTIYYPIAIHKQRAYSHFVESDYRLGRSEELSKEVLSLPMHSHLRTDAIEYICSVIRNYLN